VEHITSNSDLLAELTKHSKTNTNTEHLKCFDYFSPIRLCCLRQSHRKCAWLYKLL